MGIFFKKKFKFYLILICTVLTLLLILKIVMNLVKSISTTQVENNANILNNFIFDNFSKKVNLFDLTRPLLPFKFYNDIKCKKSIKIRGFQTSLCIHRLEQNVSRAFGQNEICESITIIFLFAFIALKF